MERDDDIGDLIRAAAPTDGCLTIAQLRDAGYGKKAIATLHRRGIIKRALRGVYVVGAAALSHAQVIRVALLAAGPNAHVAGRTALEVRKVSNPHRDGRFWIAVVGGQRRPLRKTLMPFADTGRPAIIRVRRAAGPVETDLVGGLPVATMARALVDVAARETLSFLRRTMREADYRQLLREDELGLELDRKRHGSRVLQTVLPAGPLASALRGGPDSRAAHRLLRELLDRGIVPDLVDETVRLDDGFEFRPDFKLGRLVGEVDGPHHERPERRREDKARDRRLRRAGLETLRITTKAIAADVAACADKVENAMRRIGVQNDVML